MVSIEAWPVMGNKRLKLAGKPYSTALLEDIPEVIDVFRYYAGWADKSYGQGMIVLYSLRLG